MRTWREVGEEPVSALSALNEERVGEADAEGERGKRGGKGEKGKRGKGEKGGGGWRGE